MILVAVLVGPFLLLKKRARFGMSQKLGTVPESLKQKYSASGTTRPIWFHAVSVGEFNAALPLLKRLHEKHPSQSIVVSSTTGAGHALAKERISDFADCFYFPYDLPWCTGSWLDALNPKLVTIVETEIWPGFANQCKERGIPISMVNARMSPRSFKSYYKFRAFFGPVLRNFKAIGVQSSNEFDRFKNVAGESLSVRVLGNIKFDGLQPISVEEQNALFAKLKIDKNDKVFIAGSTHEPEESAVIAAYKQLKDKKNTKLIIAPRHPERFDKVADIIRLAGFRPRRFSQDEKFEQEGNVYLLDAIGHLAKFYSVATVTFVGGTIAPIGGHNIVEPFTYGVPVIAGPHLHKTKDVADALLASDALIVVQDEDELATQLESLMNNAQRRHELGSKGEAWLHQSQGAVDRALNLIEELALLESKTETKIETAQGERR